MEKTRLRLHVHGRVQGVSFRSSAKDEAESLGLSGFVRNESDGSVTIEVEGSRGSVEAFRSWAGRGPERAEVSRLDAEEMLPTDGKGFTWR